MRRSTTRRAAPTHHASAATVGLIVEGETEFEALPRLHTRKLIPGCPPLKAINLGGIGSQRKPAGIAKLFLPKVIAHIVAGRTKVIVCIDREERETCPGELAMSVARELAAELVSRGHPSSDVHVVVADRCFEAWLLADARGLVARGIMKRSPKFHHFEGSLGKRSNKGADELTELLERPYMKTSDGPALFEKLSFRDARAFASGKHGSKSLDKLLRTLGI